MTIALCLKCGETKHGAWTPCPSCGYNPDNEEAYTKHLIMTDHHFTAEQLKEAGHKIKSGEKLKFDEDTLRRMWVSEEDIKNMDAGTKRFFYGCFAIILFITIAVVLWLFL